MKFFVITYLKSPGEMLYVESKFSGRCVFTKYISRAKFFSEEDANDLLIYLKNEKYNEKEKFIKQEVPEEYDVHNSTVFKKNGTDKGSDTPSNPQGKIKGEDDRE